MECFNLKFLDDVALSCPGFPSLPRGEACFLLRVGEFVKMLFQEIKFLALFKSRKELKLWSGGNPSGNPFYSVGSGFVLSLCSEAAAVL